MLFGQFDVIGFDCFVRQRIILQFMELLLLAVEQKGKELTGKQMNGSFPLLNLFLMTREISHSALGSLVDVFSRPL